MKFNLKTTKINEMYVYIHLFSDDKNPFKLEFYGEINNIYTDKYKPLLNNRLIKPIIEKRKLPINFEKNIRILPTTKNISSGLFTGFNNIQNIYSGDLNFILDMLNQYITDMNISLPDDLSSMYQDDYALLKQLTDRIITKNSKTSKDSDKSYNEKIKDILNEYNSNNEFINDYSKFFDSNRLEELVKQLPKKELTNLWDNLETNNEKLDDLFNFYLTNPELKNILNNLYKYNA